MIEFDYRKHGRHVHHVKGKSPLGQQTILLTNPLLTDVKNAHETLNKNT